MNHRLRRRVTYLTVAVYCSLVVSGCAAKIKSASAGLTNSNPSIKLSNKFTVDMATSAGIDPDNPALSSNGLQKSIDGTQKLASAECLLAETVVVAANQLTDKEAEEFCSLKNPIPFEKAFPTNAASGASAMNEALLHIVRWENGEWTGNWYQYERTPGKANGVLLPLTATGTVTSPPDHLLAKGGLGFLAIHFNIDDSCGISYDIKSTHTTPLNQQDVSDLISLATSYLSKGTGAGKAGAVKSASPGVGVWGGKLVLGLTRMPATVTLTPSLKKGAVVQAATAAPDGWKVNNTCTKKTGDLQASTTPQSPSGTEVQAAPTEEEQPNSSIGLQFVSQIVKPPDDADAINQTNSSLLIQAAPDKSTKGRSSSQEKPPAAPAKATPESNSLSGAALTVPDEGLHLWDVSVAMPVTPYNQRKFSLTGNVVTVKTTNSIAPYALYNQYIHRSDLRLRNAISWPMISVGLPMASRPLQRSFVGAGATIAIMNFRFTPLAGVRIEKDTFSNLMPGSTTTPPAFANSLRSEWHAKLQVVVGFSVGDAKKLFGFK